MALNEPTRVDKAVHAYKRVLIAERTVEAAKAFLDKMTEGFTHNEVAEYARRTRAEKDKELIRK